jgi:hypothetical protein
MTSAGTWIAARKRPAAVAVIVALAGLAVVASTAVATVSIARAEVSGTRLRLEGRAIANRTITVDGVAMGTSDGAGNVRIQRESFSAPADCTVDVNDGSVSPTVARLSGCTVTAPPPQPPAPSGATPPTSLSLSHNSLDQVGTLAVAGVTFAANPPTPLDFAVRSSHPGNAQVPASVHVERFSDPANPVASFTVTYVAAVSAPTPVTISVSAGGVTKTAVLTLNPTPAPTLGGGERGPGFVGADFTTFATKGTTIALGPNGVGPLRADIIAGRLPDGLRLIQPGCATPAKCPYVFIVGTPTRAQVSTFTVKATDARGQQATGTFTITINPALPLAITPQQWAPATVGSFSNLWIDGSGGVRPYRWAQTAGQLPPGMALIQDNPSGPLVRVGGTPTTAGTFGFTLRLTDATGAAVSRTFSVTVS